jgi:hypothetical protein
MSSPPFEAHVTLERRTRGKLPMRGNFSFSWLSDPPPSDIITGKRRRRRERSSRAAFVVPEPSAFGFRERRFGKDRFSSYKRPLQKRPPFFRFPSKGPLSHRKDSPPFQGCAFASRRDWSWRRPPPTLGRRLPSRGLPSHGDRILRLRNPTATTLSSMAISLLRHPTTTESHDDGSLRLHPARRLFGNSPEAGKRSRTVFEAFSGNNSDAGPSG